MSRELHSITLSPPATRIVLTDWDPALFLTKTPEHLMLELVLMSLAFDEILLPDVNTVLNDMVAVWFHQPDRFHLLEEVFDGGALTLLKLPLQSYDNSELAEQSHLEPLLARAKDIQQRRSKGSDYFSWTEMQRLFYHHLHTYLTKHPAASRRATPPEKFSIAAEFTRQLSEILEHHKEYQLATYEPFCHAAEVADLFLDCIQKPEKVVEILRKAGMRDVHVPDEFTRSLGYRLADVLFKEQEQQKKSVKSLMQSVFASVYCDCEDATQGRFTDLIPELPIRAIGEPADEEVFALSLEWDVQFPLPELHGEAVGLGEAIQRVRAEGRAFPNVREAMQRLAEPKGPKYVEDVWREIAAEFVQAMSRKDLPFRWGHVAGYVAATGTAITFASEFLPEPYRIAGVSAGFLAGTAPAVADGIWRMGGDMKRRTLETNIANSLKIRCTRI